jgi:O-succinylbenzoic acid--CoA ligase
VNSFLEEWNNGLPYVEVKTSGSTGVPKRMRVEKCRMMNSARITCDFLGLKAGDNALLCMSTDYIAGKMMVVRAIERGLQLITVEPSGHPLAGQRGLPPCIDFAAMVPLQVYNSLQVPEERERLRNIRHLIIGGGAIDEGLQAALKDATVLDLTGCSMTEVLYYVAQGNPVYAINSSGEAVLIVGYDASNVYIYNPKTGSNTTVGQTEASADFEAAGNVFISFVD